MIKKKSNSLRPSQVKELEPDDSGVKKFENLSTPGFPKAKPLNDSFSNTLSQPVSTNSFTNNINNHSHTDDNEEKKVQTVKNSSNVKNINLTL